MARRKRQRSRALLVLLVAVAAIVAVLWFQRERIAPYLRSAPAASTISAGADRVDPGNEGRRVQVAGRLEAAQPARDLQLGVSAKAAVLFRDVVVYQWHEHCDGGDCRYDMAWSSAAVDSSKFRHAGGHENPAPPFAAARFDATGLRIGAFALDPGLAAAQLQAVPLPVSAADLPPNLAAAFHASGGALYAGDDDEHPRVGAVRVSYRVVALGDATLRGVQRGTRLESR